LRIHRLLAADIFQLRFQLAIGRLTQVFQLLGLEFAHLTRFDIEHQRTIAHAADLLDMVPDLFKHLS